MFVSPSTGSSHTCRASSSTSTRITWVGIELTMVVGVAVDWVLQIV
jgi:hypothetical protein